MLTIYRLFPKSLQNVNIGKRARRISALAEELVNYRLGPYPNSMRNIDHTCARIYRPSFRENEPKTLVFFNCILSRDVGNGMNFNAT
jgi:hypothetical protein